MKAVCLDFESILFPEIWEKVAEETQIEELNLTTRDVSDYQKLMDHRFKYLKENEIKYEDIKDIIMDIRPLNGAKDFINWLEKRYIVSILTDSFYEFIFPVLDEFNRPMAYARQLEINDNGYLVDYKPKGINIKLKALNNFKEINLETIAVGDSYNDIEMLEAADKGIIFRPSNKVKEDYPKFETVQNYNELKRVIKNNL
ncbi:MAG: Phosphoserine phosphatase SerB [Candidatus Methanohalarchaeum thermophilum]|uniref:phosphoserine phosphatase n=1 Tax=Methanohalarchaeum thermophilum TaxID=1903181 RepID=A0A1Q6DVP2_METT1|nr:MAG: Phosphoserine phosphatase SerB [Candidatus Methanohalarchaeum thermophilum]